MDALINRFSNSIVSVKSVFLLKKHHELIPTTQTKPFTKFKTIHDKKIGIKPSSPSHSLQIATHESPSPYIQWHNLWLQVLKCLAHSFKVNETSNDRNANLTQTKSDYGHLSWHARSCQLSHQSTWILFTVKTRLVNYLPRNFNSEASHYHVTH
jgi:hypothetical protein